MKLKKDGTPKHLVEHAFKPGQSGNPGGRPKGSRNKMTILREDAERDLLEGIRLDMSEVVQTAIRKAKEGDNQMITLLVNKFISNRVQEDDAKAEGFGGITINISTAEGYSPVIQGEYEHTEEE